MGPVSSSRLRDRTINPDTPAEWTLQQSTWSCSVAITTSSDRTEL